MKLIIDLPSREEQISFNRQRWAVLLSDRTLADLPNKIETNAYGQILMNPPPTGDHSYRQSMVLRKLDGLLEGQPLVECPVSTLDGVKAADVGWYSDARFASVQGQEVFETAPEICVEVLSPGNSPREMKQKKQLYFEAGALEVWFCDTKGGMEFYRVAEPDERQATSGICPAFPSQIAETT